MFAGLVAIGEKGESGAVGVGIDELVNVLVGEKLEN